MVYYYKDHTIVVTTRPDLNGGWDSSFVVRRMGDTGIVFSGVVAGVRSNAAAIDAALIEARKWIDAQLA